MRQKRADNCFGSTDFLMPPPFQPFKINYIP